MLPQEPAILFSFLNLKLRDYYKNLMELCDDLDVDELELLNRMREAGYDYDRDKNQFVQR